jgi:CheY-like chemotaxis protein
MDSTEIGELLSSQTKIPFIYLTAHTEDITLKRAKNTGSKGYVKNLSDDDLWVAIELAL